MTTPPLAKHLPVRPIRKQSPSPSALGEFTFVFLQTLAETNNYAVFP
jgi:hypothetical protein